jgi:hypothetical protein
MRTQVDQELLKRLLNEVACAGSEEACLVEALGIGAEMLNAKEADQLSQHFRDVRVFELVTTDHLET